MNINPGELKHRIQIIRRDRTADADGYDTVMETVVHTCSAKLTQVSGTELVQANADFARIKVRFLIRHTAKSIDRKMLVRYAGTDYEIVYLNRYGDTREYMEIWCERLTQEE